MAWKTFAKLQNQDYEQLPVVLEDVQFHRATIMPKEGSVKFLINIFEGSGEFEICEGGSVAVSGRIYSPEDATKEVLDLPAPKAQKAKDVLPLTTADIYKELRLRGYDYGGMFRGISKSDNYGLAGSLRWDKNWISFIDTMLQFSILGQNTRELYLPTRLNKAIINPLQHVQMVQKDEEVLVHMHRNVGIIKSGGIELRGMKASLAPRRQQAQNDPKLEKYQFVPFETTKPMCENEEKARIYTLTSLLQLVLENSNGALKLKVAEVAASGIENILALKLQEILEKEPMVTVDMTVICDLPLDTSALEPAGVKFAQKDANTAQIDQNLHLVVLENALTNQKRDLLANAVMSLKPGGFVLTTENVQSNSTKVTINNDDLELVSQQLTVASNGKTYVLMRKIAGNQAQSEPVVIRITDKNFDWVEPVKSAMKSSETDANSARIYLVTEAEELTGLVGMVNCLKQEPGGNNVRALFIQDLKAEKFSISAKMYAEQMKKDLAQNVLKNGVWGTFRHLPLDQVTDGGKLQVEHAYINTLTRGDLSSLRWIEGPLTYYKYVFIPTLLIYLNGHSASAKMKY